MRRVFPWIYVQQAGRQINWMDLDNEMRQLGGDKRKKFFQFHASISFSSELKQQLYYPSNLLILLGN